MGEVSLSRLTILCALLLATTLLIHGTTGGKVISPDKEPLQQVLARNRSLELVQDFPLESRLITMLNLDDYLFQSYMQGGKPVTLYIGYYRSAKKVGAAHDPLVCFQGQGWSLSDRETGNYVLSRNPAMAISYASMIASRPDERVLIVYWFQANGRAVTTTLAQKTAMVVDKLFGNSEDNAFIRISAPIGTESLESVRKRVFDFVEGFYPDFYQYVTNTKKI